MLWQPFVWTVVSRTFVRRTPSKGRDIVSLQSKVQVCLPSNVRKTIQLSPRAPTRVCGPRWRIHLTKLRSKAAMFHFQFSHSLIFATPWTAARQASLSITKPQSSLKLTSIESVIPSNYLILCRPLLLLPSIFPSIKVFSNESVLCIRWPKYWSFSFSISPSNEYSGLISFRIEWFDLLAVEGTLKSLLQHHSSKASILQCSAFFIQLLERKKVKESEVSQSCPTLCDPMVYSPAGSSIHGILQARVLEWVAISFSLSSFLGDHKDEVFQV